MNDHSPNLQPRALRGLLAICLCMLLISGMTPWCCLIGHSRDHRPSDILAPGHVTAHAAHAAHGPADRGAAATLRSGVVSLCPWKATGPRPQVAARAASAVPNRNFESASRTRFMLDLSPRSRPAPLADWRLPHLANSPPDTPPPRAA